MLQFAKYFAPWVGLLAAILIAIIGLPDAIAGIQAAQDVDTFKSTRATITAQHEEKRKKGPNSYVVKFDYHVNQRLLRGSNHLTVWTDDKETVLPLLRKEESGKETILVFYDPKDPKTVVIHKDIPIFPHVIIISMTVIIFIASIIFIVTAQAKRRYLKKSRQALQDI